MNSLFIKIFKLLPFFLLLLNINVSAESTKSLFKTPLNNIKSPAKHTFIFWINGDAERFRPSAGTSSNIVRIDKQDIEDVRRGAKNCNCNVVLFFDQRGSDYWYTLRQAWGAYLEVYSNGQLQKFEKSSKRRSVHKNIRSARKKKRLSSNKNAGEINQASPEFLKELLVFSEQTFPNTELHLIYRGHSFSTPYLPNDKEAMIAPFDYSNPETKYSVNVFVDSLKSAELEKKLASITFAACTMSYIEVLGKLAPYTNQVISSQIPILETGTTGFNLAFSQHIKNSHTNKQVTKIIAKNLFNKIKTSPHITDIIREAIISVVDLTNFGKKSDQFVQLINQNQAKISTEIYDRVKITVKPSNKYIEEKIKLKVKEGTINILKSRVVFGEVSDSVDLISLLNEFSKISDGHIYKDLAKELENRITNYGYSEFSGKNGINIKIPRLNSK